VEGLLIASVIAAAVISRPVEARLWRAGKLSERSMAILLVGRFPIVAFLFAVISGRCALLVLAITVVGLLPAVAFYRSTLSLLRDQKRA
jgi:hypothetical protein